MYPQVTTQTLLMLMVMLTRKPQEPNAPVLKDSRQPDGETQMIVPGNVNADKDHFKDIDRQAELKQRLDQELSTAP